MGEQTLTIMGFPNRFQIFRANNSSDVFTQKCLCTTSTQEYFLPLDKKSSEIEEHEIRRKNHPNEPAKRRGDLFHNSVVAVESSPAWGPRRTATLLAA